MEQIQRLWDALPHIDGTVIRWMAKKAGRSIGDFVTTAYELSKVTSVLPTWDIYVAPNPCNSRIGTRHSTGDVTHWSWFLIDIDPMLPDPNPVAALDEALLWLGEWTAWELDPFKLDSGRGAQAWIRLDDMCLDDRTRRMVPQTMRYWLHRLDKKLGMYEGCRVDTTCSDLPRIMRCAGTWNHKTGRMATILADGRPHAGLAKLLMTGVPPEEFVIHETSSGICIGKPWQYAVSYMTDKAKTYINAGWQEPGRHDAMWHTAKKFQELGISKEEARKGLMWGNELCRNGAGEPSPLDSKDIEHALSTAYK